MQRLLVIDRDLFTCSNVTQSKEQDMAVESFHIRVRFARVIDVMRAVAAAAAVQAPAAIDVTDAQDTPVPRSLSCFQI